MDKSILETGKTIVIDKPYQWTSFDVVNKIRWHLKQALKIKKIKVGHAGTLDPLATGVLIICIGKHTKNIESIMGGEKTYTGTFLLGKTTPSYDLETQFNQDYPVDHIKHAMMEEVCQTFLGDIDQIPPVFSAKKIDGKRAYELARADKEVEMKPSRVNISKFTINSERFPEIDFEITCSKGTYIRSIAHDFGKKLNSGSTLIALRRTKSGEFNVENSYEVEEVLEKIKGII